VNILTRRYHNIADKTNTAITVTCTKTRIVTETGSYTNARRLLGHEKKVYAKGTPWKRNRCGMHAQDELR
jgi:hypothetical protein